MNAQRQGVVPANSSFTPVPSGLLQRKCACGTHTMGGGQCADCQKKQVNGKPLQSKLAISEPGDAYEQEADHVAKQVMRMSTAELSKKQNGNTSHSLMQRRATGGTTGFSEAPPIVHEVLNSPGQPLAPTTRAFFEPRFGYDFSDVRVHSGAAAEQSARDVSAHAYTVGHNVVFGAGRLSSDTHEGRQLLAHELTHVVQQRAIGPRIARVSWGEKWDALWGAGPIDAKRASELANEALREAQRVAGEMGLPRSSLHNGPPDAWRHCYWNCRMVQVIGKEDAADIARIHEEHGGNPTAERMMDDWNNEEGRSCSGDCDTCCQHKLDSGKLWILYGGKVGASQPVPRTPGATPSGGKYEKY